MNSNFHCRPLKNIKNLDTCCVIDVRCEREYTRGHMTNAINIPLFNNNQYQKLGETYRKSGPSSAVNLGKQYANKRCKSILEKVENIKEKEIIIYCARGGMRSEGFQKILYESEIDSIRIKNGYKSIRKQNLDIFLDTKKIIVIAGSTGSGKTTILKKMKNLGHNVIDLEGTAHHRGSAFGDIGIEQQATQQQFENDLAHEWSKISNNSPIYIESESRKIGKVVIPEKLWEQMSSGYYIKIEMDISRRIDNLMHEYGAFPVSEFMRRLNLISKKLGGEQTQSARKYLVEGNLKNFCKLLLDKYYDKMYMIAYENRKSKKDILHISREPNSIIIEKLTKLI